MNIKRFSVVSGLTFAAVLISSISSASAWGAPSGAPSAANNAPAPINVGTASQNKNGSLGVSGLGVFGNSLLTGTLGVTGQTSLAGTNLTAGSYLNFGATTGSLGYGIWDNGGILKFKNNAGSWQTIQDIVAAASGGISGSGTTGKIPRFTSSTALGDSSISSDGVSSTANGNFFTTGNVNVTGNVNAAGGIVTQTHDDAGAAGGASGFYQTAAPVNFPTGATGWWHLIEDRHTNTGNNYALQIAGSFSDQNLYFRKTNNSGTTGWSEIIAANSAGKVGIGTDSPSYQLSLYNSAASAYFDINAPLAQQSSIQFSDTTNGKDWVLYRVDNTRNFGLWNPTVGTVMAADQTTGDVTFRKNVQANTVTSTKYCIGTSCITSWATADFTGPYVPAYSAWSVKGTGGGGAGIYNDDGSGDKNGILYKKLMIVGNNSAGGLREVGVWDNLTVTNKLIVGGYVGTNGVDPIRSLTVGGGEISIIKQASGWSFLNVSDGAGNGGGYLWIRGLDNGGKAGLTLDEIKLDAKKVSSGREITGTLASGSAQFRMVAGHYGSMWRQDGATTYLLVTNYDDQYGSWNTLRPFYVDNASGNVTMSNVTASSFLYSSDQRLKKDIAPLQGALAMVELIRPVTYQWKDASKPAGDHIGFIAQNVQQIAPDLVHTDASTTLESVDYARMTPILTGAVQELDTKSRDQAKQIDALTSQVAAQQREIDSLNREMRQLLSR